MEKKLADVLIEKYHLEPLPEEGGLYYQTYKSPEEISREVLPDRYREKRPFGTAILFLLTDHPNSFSAMHRLLTDEIYHFYLGDPIEMLQLYPDGSHRIVVIGNDILAGQEIQYVAPRGAWQGSRLKEGGSYALIGTTMAPGFEWGDFELGKSAELIREYPAAEKHIRRLTR